MYEIGADTYSQKNHFLVVTNVQDNCKFVSANQKTCACYKNVNSKTQLLYIMEETTIFPCSSIKSIPLLCTIAVRSQPSIVSSDFTRGRRFDHSWDPNKVIFCTEQMYLWRMNLATTKYIWLSNYLNKHKSIIKWRNTTNIVKVVVNPE